jgi:cytoskeleton-associated protein 5
MKVKKAAANALFAMAEKNCLQFVLSSAYPAFNNLKAPKAIADSVSWVQQAILEFGLDGIQLPTLIDFLKKALSNPNQAARSAAVSTFATIQSFNKVGKSSVFFC